MTNISKIMLIDICICSLLFYSCQSTVPIIDSVQLEAHEKTGLIRVLTNDGTLYKLNSYSIADSLLIGEGTSIINLNTVPFHGSIKLSEIAGIETDKPNLLKMVFVAGFFITMVLLVIPSFQAKHDLESGTSTEEKWNFKSCPFVYTYDGNTYHFESETFAGAVFKNAERASFDMLHHLKEVDGMYRLKITAERDETNYINEIRLIAIDASTGLEIIPDRNGTPHMIANKIAPLHCTDFDGNDVRDKVISRDSIFWESNLAQKDFKDVAQFRDGLILDFEKPTNAHKAKLVVRGINTALGVFALENIFRLPGDSRLRWLQELETDKKKSDDMIRFMKQSGMLHISVWIDGKWQEQTALFDVGPGLVKDQLAILDLNKVPENTCRIKLESTTDLWKIDNVYIDYSSDASMTITELSIASARDESGRNITSLLQKDDGQYYISFKGDAADLMFIAPPVPEHATRSIMLKSKGYYYQWVRAQGEDKSKILERILTDPAFGARTFLPLWKSVRGRYN